MPPSPRILFHDRLLEDGGPATGHGPARIGGKAYGLLRLAQAGLRVPAWWLVPAEWFVASVGSDFRRRSLPEIRDRLAALDLSALRAAVEATVLGPDPGAAGDDGGRWVVRTSMVGEDSAADSFAGQTQTITRVAASADAIAEAVQDCWASAYASSLHAYAHSRGFATTWRPLIAVIVQRWVEPAAAGVAFSRDPAPDGEPFVRIEAVRGEGSRLVDGAETPCTIRHDGVVRAVSIHDGDPPISPARITQIARAAREMEALTGEPQDVEWVAGSDGIVSFVQSRPITSLPYTPRPLRVLDDSNIQESYAGITSAMTASWIREAYTSVYSQTLRLLGRAAEVENARPVLRRMLAFVNGRVFYDLDAWFRALAYLPGFTRNKADMEAMMGVTSPVHASIGGGRSGVRRAVGLVAIGVRLLNRIRRLPRDAERFYRRVDRLRSTARALAESGVAEEALAAIAMVRHDIIGSWTTPIVNDIAVMRATGRLRRALTRELGSQAAAESFMAQRLAGPSMAIVREPSKRLAEMADMVRASGLSLAGDGPSIDVLREAVPGFAAAWDAYFERFGDRCPGELKLETITPWEEPDRVRRAVVAQAATPSSSASSPVDNPGQPVPRRLRRLMHQAQAAVGRREVMRWERGRTFGVLRAAIRSLGRDLVRQGELPTVESVFDLTLDELCDWYSGQATSQDLAAVAAVRRSERERYAAITMPSRLAFVGSPYAGRAAAEEVTPAMVDVADGDDGLRGSGCSAGVVEGEVAVLTDPMAAGLEGVRGRILVAERTDPGWGPLFPMIAGVIVERGGMLSHAAILAREFGIPAVIGARDATRRLHDGDRIRIDGSTGEITVLPADPGRVAEAS